MAFHRVEEYKVLEATGGRPVKVRLYPGPESMVAKLVVTDEEVDSQCKVKVHMCDGVRGTVRVAFSFVDQYVLKVNGENLELEDKQIENNSIHSSYQFQCCSIMSGTYSALKTVDLPTKYLYIKDGKIGLSSNNEVYFRLESWSD